MAQERVATNGVGPFVRVVDDSRHRRGVTTVDASTQTDIVTNGPILFESPAVHSRRSFAYLAVAQPVHDPGRLLRTLREGTWS